MAATPTNEGAIIPEERVNIRYRTETNGAVEESELPLRMLVVGDFTGRPDATEVEKRKPAKIDKNNFDEVMKSHNVGMEVNVPNLVDGKPDDQLNVKLQFNSIKDFGPESVANQVPQLRTLLKLREALAELKGPLAQNLEFRKKLQALLEDEAQLGSLLDEIEVGPASE